MAEPRQSFRQRCGFNDPDLKSPVHDRMVLWIGDNSPGWIAAQLNHDPLEKCDHYIAQLKKAWQKSLAWRMERIADEEEAIAQYSPGGERAGVPYAEGRCKSALREIERLRKEHAGITAEAAAGLALPVPQPMKTEVTFETPVMSGSFIVGFVDALAAVQVPEYWLEGIRDHSYASPEPEWKFHWQTSHFAFEAKPKIPSLGELLRQLRAYKAYWRNARFVVVSPDVQYRDAILKQDFGFWEYPATGLNG